ncbi:MAG TPA: hypothetical protein VEF72_27945 [Mycobacterium sp.]|nr:hypothetical protein [Mycobacterium sp.]
MSPAADPDTPLYVGESTNILARLGSHAGDRQKRYLIERVQLIRCEDEYTMHATEGRLIGHYRPLFNQQGLSAQTIEGAA